MLTNLPEPIYICVILHTWHEHCEYIRSGIVHVSMYKDNCAQFRAVVTRLQQRWAFEQQRLTHWWIIPEIKLDCYWRSSLSRQTGFDTHQVKVRLSAQNSYVINSACFVYTASHVLASTSASRLSASFNAISSLNRVKNDLHISFMPS